MSDWVIEGGRVLHPHGLEEDDLHMRDGRIADGAAHYARRFDAAGLDILPGIVDLHGDAFERILQPRPGVTFPTALALEEADRQMVANGITTAWHGLTVSWEPGLRSLETARRFVDAFATIKDGLSCDTNLNLRWETFALDAMADVAEWMTRFPGTALSINDHTTVNVGQPVTSRKIGRMAERTGLTREDCMTALDTVWAWRNEVPPAIIALCASAAKAGVTVFAHDETSPEERAANRALGIAVTEFPMTMETAHAAISAGEAVVLGAPNILRGGSQNNAICAAEAIRANACSVLASDYYYPAPLLAAYQLADEMGLEQAWPYVSTLPARAVGLVDRGALVTGLRADVIAVDPRTRKVRAVFSRGRKVLELG